MKNLFSRNRREPSPTQEPVLESRRLQEREENDRFLRQLYANQDPDAGATLADSDPSGAGAAQPGDAPRGAQAEAAAPAVPQAPGEAGETHAHDDAADGTRAALELLEVARQLLEGRDDVESRVARQLVARALELIPAPGGRRG